MRLILYSIILIVLVLAATVSSCRIKKNIVKPVIGEKQANNACASVDSVYYKIKKADNTLSWFGCKVSANTEIDKKSNSFVANIRVRVDSAIWISITPALGIEVARVMITKDTLKLINRIDGTYFVGDYRILKELLQTDINFQMVQSVLMGSTYLHYPLERYVSELDNGWCLLSTLRKRQLKRETDLPIPEILTQEIWASPETYKVSRMEMQDYRPSRRFVVQYHSYQLIEEKTFPDKITVQASAAKSAKIELEYSRLQINKSLNLPFSIPESYVPMR